jgi:hypothetical protein
MTYKICYWDDISKSQKERDATTEEAAEIDARKIAPPSVPQTVTMRQARLALNAAGLLSATQTAIDSGGEDAKITWEYSSEVHRNNGLIPTMAASLGMTETQIDNLFILAATL